MRKMYKRYKEGRGIPILMLNNILVTILGVIWVSPMDVVIKSEIGKVFQPWVLACIPLLMHFANILSSFIKNITVTSCNKILILLDLFVFCNICYLLFTEDFKIFIVTAIILSSLFTLIGSAYKVRMKDIVSKVWMEEHENYLAVDLFLNGFINILILSIGLLISTMVTDNDYRPLIYYSLCLGVISISYEIWFMKPLAKIEAMFHEWKRNNTTRGE